MTDRRAWAATMAHRDDWLAQVQEPVLCPEIEIVDPHHHLWNRGGSRYHVQDLWRDTNAGHNVTQTVFVECHASYYETGPEHLRPVGETEFAAAQASTAREEPSKAQIAGVIAHADLRSPYLEEVLDAHEKAAQGLLCGIRHLGAHDPTPNALIIPGRAPPNLYRDEAFRRGLETLGKRELTYDTWHYHHQNSDFAELAAAIPNVTMVLDHFGTPLGVGRFATKREEVFAQWQQDITDIAKLPNVVAKLGGLAMPDNGFGWHERSKPPTSDDFVTAQARYYHHAIASFGANRCMFESNFPVDRISISYRTLWNGMKKIAASYDQAAQRAMLSGTARRIYRLKSARY
jgi:L-fuconolactonase